MTTTVRATEHHEQATSLGQRRIGIPALVFMIIAASAPLTVVAGGSTTNFAVTEVLGIPVSFLVLGALLMVFTVGYSAMSQHIHNAGAFYAYAAKGLGKPVGVGAAWVALMGYNSMQIGLYGLFGFASASFASGTLGLDLPWWAWALVAWAIVGILGISQVDFSAKVLGILVAAEFVVVIIYDIIAFNVAPEGVNTQALEPAALLVPGIGAVLVFSIAAFMGFESGAIYNEEVKDPQKTAGRATFIALAVIGLFYAFSSWAMTIAEGPSNIVGASQEHGPDLMFVFFAQHTPGWFVDLANLLFITSLLAALVAFHNVVSRYFFSLGRERVLPHLLGLTSAKTGAPLAGSMTQSVLALLIGAAFAIAGIGHEYGELFPVLTMFTWLTNAAALGLVFLMALSGLAVLSYLNRYQKQYSVWTRMIAPGIAALGLITLFTLSALNFEVLIDLEGASILSWLLPMIILVPGALGTIWAWLLKSRKPEIYAGIGGGGSLD